MRMDGGVTLKRSPVSVLGSPSSQMEMMSTTFWTSHRWRRSNSFSPAPTSEPSLNPSRTIGSAAFCVHRTQPSSRRVRQTPDTLPATLHAPQRPPRCLRPRIPACARCETQTGGRRTGTTAPGQTCSPLQTAHLPHCATRSRERNNAAGEGGGHRYASAAQGADLRTGAACAWNFRRLNVTFSPWVTGSSSYSSPPSPSPSPAASPAMSTAAPSFCHHANTRTHTQGAECEHVARSHRAPPPRDSSRPSTRTFSSPSSLGVAASSSAAFIASAAHKPVLTCTEIRAAAQVRIRNVRATDTLRPPH